MHPQDVAPSLPLLPPADAFVQGAGQAYFSETAYAHGHACYEAGRAAGRASAEPEGFVLVPRELVAFLNGEAAIDGVWYGERHPDHKGMFWWRKALMAAAAPTPTASIAPKAEGEAVAAQVASGEMKLWLWKNGDHYLAFEHLYPCFTPGGDPMTLGEPAGHAILKHSFDRTSRAAPAPVAQAAAGASDDTRRLDWMESGAWIPVQTMLEMNWSNREQTRKYRIGEEGPWSATLREAVDKASDFRPPRPEADADRASGGGV